MAAYIGAQTKKHGAVTPTADNNWKLATIKAPQPLDIRFETSPGDKAAAFIKSHTQYPVTAKGTDDIGFEVYQVDLQK